MTWSGDCFDRFGDGSIVLKSYWYGAMSLLIGLSLIQYVEHPKFPLVPALLAVALLCADFNFDYDDLQQRTPLDKLISFVGHLVSRPLP
jgi:hypothetical protein